MRFRASWSSLVLLLPNNQRQRRNLLLYCRITSVSAAIYCFIAE
jgi:hypothetical protein